MHITGTKAGKQFVKLTKSETEAIIDLAFRSLQRIPLGELTADEHFLSGILSDLIRDHDFHHSSLVTLLDISGKHGVEVDPAILMPSRAYEQYRGLKHSEAHKVRAFQNGLIIRKFARKYGIDMPDRLHDVYRSLPANGESAEIVGFMARMRAENTAKARKRRAQRKQDEPIADEKIKENPSMIRRRQLEIENQQLKRANARLNAARMDMHATNKEAAVDLQGMLDEYVRESAAFDDRERQYQERIARMTDEIAGLKAKLSEVEPELRAVLSTLHTENDRLKRIQSEDRTRIAGLENLLESARASVPSPVPMVDRMKALAGRSNVIAFPRSIPISIEGDFIDFGICPVEPRTTSLVRDAA